MPEATAAFIVSTFAMIMKLIRAGEDKTQQEEALMEYQERLKQEIDRRAFSDTSRTNIAG